MELGLTHSFGNVVSVFLGRGVAVADRIERMRRRRDLRMFDCFAGLREGRWVWILPLGYV